MELIEKFSSEAFRYYFTSQCPFGGDGEFSFERFADAYNSGLADNLGNNYSRILTMCLKYFDGRLEGLAAVNATEWRRSLDLEKLVGSLSDQIRAFEYSAGLADESGTKSSPPRAVIFKTRSHSSWPRPTWRPAMSYW